MPELTSSEQPWKRQKQSLISLKVLNIWKILTMDTTFLVTKPLLNNSYSHKLNMFAFVYKIKLYCQNKN